MSMKEWMELDAENLEMLDVTDAEKARVKQHVLKKRENPPVWRTAAAAAVIVIGASAAAGFAVPSIASQIPFMDDVIAYFQDENQGAFDEFSTDIGLAETDNGATVMIDDAVYDGTNITVSFAIETERNLGESVQMSGADWFEVAGSDGSAGTGEITKISDTRYVGLSTFNPHFKNGESPEKVDITWSPQGFIGLEKDTEIKGDWSFDFSLERLEGKEHLVNETVKNEDVTFTLESVEYTDGSTVISYEQIVKEDFLEKWPSVTPVFKVTDGLGHVYLDGTSGPGVSTDDGKTFEGTTDFGRIQEGARELIIEPVIIASLTSGKGHKEIELDPIVIKLKE
jgi:Family of unknown function (DUF5643)/Domain of unknown function (DUF4179)